MSATTIDTTAPTTKASETAAGSIGRAGRIAERLRESELFKAYRKAFLSASGLPLTIEVDDGEGWDLGEGGENANRFCTMLNRGAGCCENCSLACQDLANKAESKVCSSRCFAGLRETAIPIRVDGRAVAFLKTGQVFNAPPSKKDWAKVESILSLEGASDHQIEQLEGAYYETPLMEKSQYNGLTTLLAAFSLQLSALAANVVQEEEHEPDALIKAKRFINANLAERITLEKVAEHASVSTFYFCKLFKATTGMTLTEYVNRRRVAWAKRLLLRKDLQVTEVAYEVGYRSLSQFNRSFLRYAKVSPSKFREQQGTGEGALTAAS